MDYNLQGKNIIISGAKGFIGSNLVKKLAANNNIIAVDNLLHAPNRYEYQGVQYLDCCISHALKKLQDQHFDLFFHLGEYSRVEQSVCEPMLAFENSTNTILPVIDFCEAKQVKLIYSGSSTKFGKYGENYESPYAKFKKINTEWIKAHAAKSKLKYAICYFYNVYGDTESDDPKYGTLIKKYTSMYNKNQHQLPVTSPGTQRRNFTHIDDTINALIYIAHKGVGDGYGICADEIYSILDVVKLFGCEPVFTSPQKGNRLDADNLSEKTKALGWRQQQTLEEFIKTKINGV